MKNLLKVSLVLGLLVCAASVMAQTTGNMATKDAAAGVVGSDVVVDLTGHANNIINWDKFIQDKNLYFHANTAVLNRVLDKTDAAEINKAIVSYTDLGVTKGGEVYFSAPGGVYFGKGATIEASAFLATTADLAAVPGTFADGVIEAYNAKKPFAGFEGWGGDVLKLTIGDTKDAAGANLWLIGLDRGDAAHTAEYDIGAWAPNQADGPEMNANLKLEGGRGPLVIGTHVFDGKKVWLGNITAADATGNGVYLFGPQIWVKSILTDKTTGWVVAVGGDGGKKTADDSATVNWNDGVWIYGNKIEPLAWPKGADYDDSVVLRAGAADISGHQVWISATSDVGFDITLGDNAMRDTAYNTNNFTDVDPFPGGNTFIIWTVDIAAGRDVDLSATGTVPNTTPWIYGLASVPTGKGGSIWVNSVKADGDFTAEAIYGIVVWNYNGSKDCVVDVAGDITFLNADGEEKDLEGGFLARCSVCDYKAYGVYEKDNGSQSYYW